MKKVLFVMLSAALLTSCFRMGHIQAVKPDYQNVVTPEFEEFLKSKENLSVILRVPTTTSSATQSEAPLSDTHRKAYYDVNMFYTFIEKQLISNGFQVGDRGLFNPIITAGATDYQEIAKKTGADVIIEIISLGFPLMYNGKAILAKDTPLVAEYAEKHIGIEHVVIEIKLVQVNNGKTGVIRTFDYTARDPFAFYYRNGFSGIRMTWDKRAYHNRRHTWLQAITDTSQKNQAIELFCKDLVALLKGE